MEQLDVVEPARDVEKTEDVARTSAVAGDVELTSALGSMTIEAPPATTTDAGAPDKVADAAAVLQSPADRGLPVDADVAPVVLEAGPATAVAPARAPAAAGAAGLRSWRHRGEVEDATTQLSWNRSCVFCEIVAGKRDATVVYEDERFLAFKDIRPAGNPHYQVIPKHHVRDITALRPDAHDIEMVEAMIAIGSMLVARDHPQPNGASRLAFHRPPLISVPHLHLHTIGLPLRGIGYLKHGAIFRWSADATLVLTDLRKQAATKK